MKKLMLLTIMVLWSAIMYAPAQKTLFIQAGTVITVYAVLRSPIGTVETGNISCSINTAEMAYGMYQIRQCKLDDYNRANGTSYNLQDCLDDYVSDQILRWHCNQYTDIEMAARRWNGSGPMTDQYWKKVHELILRE